MEKSNKHTKKLLSLFWFICMSAPLLVLIVLFVNGTFRQEFTMSFDTFDNLCATYINSNFGSFTSNLFGDFMTNIENIFVNDLETSSVLLTFNSIIYWYIFVSLVHIVVDLILFIPNLIKLVFKKVGVKDVE